MLIMGQPQKKTNGRKTTKKKRLGFYIGSGVLAVLLAVFILMKTAGGSKAGTVTVQTGGDITITKTRSLRQQLLFPMPDRTD
jgi:hypothetical protein